MTRPYFCNNKKNGKISVGDVVVVKEVFKEGIVLEKKYIATTLADINEGLQRVGSETIYVGKKRVPP